jgi:hypothetical protein
MSTIGTNFGAHALSRDEELKLARQYFPPNLMHYIQSEMDGNPYLSIPGWIAQFKAHNNKYLPGDDEYHPNTEMWLGPMNRYMNARSMLRGQR